MIVPNHQMKRVAHTKVKMMMMTRVKAMAKAMEVVTMEVATMVAIMVDIQLTRQ